MDDALRDAMRQRLQAFEVHRAAHGANSHAAVALAVAEEGLGAGLPGLSSPAGWSREAALILTRRARTLSRHAGQWALPGGRVDTGESDEAAALRELAEEVDLHLEASAILGRLDDYVTRSGFVISPVVVWAGAARELKPNPGEVASIHRIRLQEFMRADAPMLEAGDDPARPIMRMPLGADWIAAPTAALIYQLRELLAGRVTRVGHFDQPEFARR
ncbi:NUDIX hydrolase [Ramlibacter sp.]|uniref:NUDIX hydrolase n=1 Tax=Ramlibacter sp. TaxID=1917967 RepID=UPI003D14B0A5